MSMRLSAAAFTAASALALTACATTAAPQTQQEAALVADMEARSIIPATRDERQAIANQDLLTQAAFWAEAYELNPADREAATELARVLRLLGSSNRATEVARQALALYPDDTALLGIYGLALAADGHGQQALEPLTRAVQAEPGNWRLHNALGVSLEQTGRTAEARARFQQALALAPAEASILSNLALSHALAGEPDQAEPLLRRAMQSDSASAQVRQNLALVLALQGRFDEAERIAVLDSSPEMTAANLDYVREMMTSPRRWDSLNAAALRGSQ